MVFKFERKKYRKKKCEKKKEMVLIMEKNSVIIETFLNVCANSGRCSLF